MKSEGKNAARLSIIVPCLDEAPCIVAALERLQPLRRRRCEVIVVDGGSSDDSVALAAPFADLTLSAPRGRALQMNAGAGAARGEVLLFLHADCFLPPNADRSICGGLAASRRRWGRFDVTLAGTHPLLRVIAVMMNWRSRLTGIATGDQGLFVTRELFVAVGGYPRIALMEDIALSKRLKAHGAPLCLTARITASDRRWKKHGVLRTIVLMWRLRLAYFCGADPADLGRRYDGSAGVAETRVLVFAKAPVAGMVKTRLIPLLGAEGAATLQRVLTEHALVTALDAGLGPVELWGAPSARHPLLAGYASRLGVTMASQCDGDLGARMMQAAPAALKSCSRVIILGTDCPAMTPAHLWQAAAALDAYHDAVFIPAEDGGYVLIGLKRCDARLFSDIAWGSNQVMAATRERLATLGWQWRELPSLWDVDRPADYQRLLDSGIITELGPPHSNSKQMFVATSAKEPRRSYGVTLPPKP